MFLSQLKETNATLDYFVDFEKVKNNVNKVSLKLNQLNYLLGKENLKEAITEIYTENKSSFEVLNILIAVRDDKVKTIYNGKFYSLKDFFDSPEDIYTFIKLTKLEEVFQNHNIKNLVDYVYGIEVGLDSNARKNRGGDNMSKIIENLFIINNIPYRKEVKSTEFLELTSLGVDIKKFDFVVVADKIYLIEVNFYTGQGSKLNETSRSYIDIASKINQNKNFEFIWITDGTGWNSAKNKLEEAYNNIPSIFNLTTLQEFIDKIKNYYN
ncbi:type II restriction endonuclease [Fusobacterium mortiferum]|nr:type II restriction endonuclease [Fusobacterium mortiferum]